MSEAFEKISTRLMPAASHSVEHFCSPSERVSVSAMWLWMTTATRPRAENHSPSARGPDTSPPKPYSMLPANGYS